MLLLSESRNDLASEEKKLLLESYGLDPHEFLSEPAPPKVFSLSLSIYIYQILFGFWENWEKEENSKI